MTSNELRHKFDNIQGKWPITYEIDHETYANVCQDLFDNIERDELITFTSSDLSFQRVKVSLGSHNGIMFKNVELILTKG